ncbi:MAG: M23 family metallopeptidase [Bacteroidales bacterium]|nr:M23 family metallopeptidase [Bacteroidales bacterium]MBQ9202600.1 M23 family metallopeptidase [Bacteroidales bacterium]
MSRRMLVRTLSALMLFQTAVRADKAFSSPRRPAWRVTDSIRPSDFQPPLDIPLLLSANFGELRKNHFHTGLDIKTQGVTGKTVRAVADGWVSRLAVSRYGYGKAVYIDHPNGYTSVYGHLESFAPRLDSVVREAQYNGRSYVQNLFFEPGELPVSRGQALALSGNTGSSGGPHLHFEIRETESEEPMDPLLWFSDRIVDDVKPRVQALAVYAPAGEGVLSNGQDKQIVAVNTGQTPLLPAVWGRIGLGLKAYDYMSGTINVYGVCRLQLFVDEKEVFSQELNRFSFDESRYVNALTDYAEWALHNSWIMKSFRLPFNELDVYPSVLDDGYVTVEEERPYPCRYVLSDRHGNTTVVDFVLEGRKMEIPPVDTTLLCFSPQYDNRFVTPCLRLSLPRASLYEPLYFRYRQQPSSEASDIFELHDLPAPVHTSLSLELAVMRDHLADKGQYFLAHLNQRGRWEFVPAVYDDGWMRAEVRELGSYTVLTDTVAPKIILPSIDNVLKNVLIRIGIRDDETDIAGYECLIDGNWALFEDDYKNASIFYRPDGRALRRSEKPHRLSVKVWDVCGNVASKEWQFNY